jgi:hypothetical protein
MNRDHRDIVLDEYNEAPADKTVAGALHFLERVLRRLPPEERGGFQLKPAGENIAPYRGHLVSVSRIMYPDGQLVKILSDVPTTNGPIWTIDPHRIDAGLYLPLDAAPAGGGRPGREEMMRAGEALEQFYRAPEGLQRATGLYVYGPGGTPEGGHVDWEGVGAWLFDVYFTQRLNGATPDQAAAEVRRQIEASDEWQRKHP